jgi:hypothetical protein
MAKAPRTKKPASAVLWGVYKITPARHELVYGMGRTRDEAVNAAARELGFPLAA